MLAFSDDNKLTVWDIMSTKKHLEMTLHDRVICAIHPHTYLNKVLLAFEDGSMQLWNLKSKELVYNFKGWGSPIRSLQQSPALDVVAVGLHDGRLTLAATISHHLYRACHCAEPSLRRDDRDLLSARPCNCACISHWHVLSACFDVG